MPRDTVVHEMPRANRGAELYSAWFGSARDGILYFGLSPFWQRMREADGDPTAELRESGSLLIGRFDLTQRRFLEPLVAAPGSHPESTWDVLAHSNGRIYFTTFFGAMGSVAADGSDAQLYPSLGHGLNELYEAPNGAIFVTRYAGQGGPQAPGTVLVVDPRGRRIEEWQLEALPGTRLSPKSIAVDPFNAEVWINTDTFGVDPAGAVLHETLRISAEGNVLERWQDPELMMVSFDALGVGWFAKRQDGRLQLRRNVDRNAGPDEVSIDLGPIGASDFVQDISFATTGETVLTRWSGRIHIVAPSGARRIVDLTPEGEDCNRTGGPGLHYTAVLWESALFVSRHCGGQIVEKQLSIR